MAFQVRITRVRLKAGAELVRLPRGDDDTTAVIKAEAKHAVDVMRNRWSDVKGCVIVWWDRHGAYERLISTAKVNQPIPRTLIPAYVHDLVLREITEAGTLKTLDDRAER